MSGTPSEGSWEVCHTFPAYTVVAKAIFITPCPSPRMNQNTDRKKPPIQRYFSFREKLQALIKPSEICWEPLSIQFMIPMPSSWSKKKKQQMYLQKHLPKPDLDNLIKAFKDSLLKEDSKVWCYGAMNKVWSYEGRIIVLNPQKDCSEPCSSPPQSP